MYDFKDVRHSMLILRSAMHKRQRIYQPLLAKYPDNDPALIKRKPPTDKLLFPKGRCWDAAKLLQSLFFTGR